QPVLHRRWYNHRQRSGSVHFTTPSEPTPMSKKRRPRQGAAPPPMPTLPYGLLDLDPVIQTVQSPEFLIRCFVRGCEHFLRPPTRQSRGDVCPIHGIRTHRSGTFSYPDPGRNAIVARDLLASRIVGNPYKFESHRLGYEKSEDMLTFNLFRS